MVKKMVDYIVLLPEDADSWSFSLVEMFPVPWNQIYKHLCYSTVLKYQKQVEVILSLDSVLHLLRFEQGIRMLMNVALSTIRLSTNKSKRLQLVIILVCVCQVATNHVGLDQGTIGYYETLSSNVSSCILTDDKIYTYSFEPGAF